MFAPDAAWPATCPACPARPTYPYPCCVSKAPCAPSHTFRCMKVEHGCHPDRPLSWQPATTQARSLLQMAWRQAIIA